MARTKKSKPILTTKPSRWESASLGNKLTFIGLIMALLGFPLAYYLGNPSRKKDSREIEALQSQNQFSPDLGCGFPTHFVRDTLYLLITRFEDLQNKSGLECYGRGIERRIDQLVENRQLPIRFCYRDDLRPTQRSHADRFRDESSADLIIWGKLQNASPDCTADGFCLQFNPSDTLIRYAGGEVRKPSLDDYQRGISAYDIEQGLINMGKERFDDWLIGMFNLKIGRRKPELFVIDEAWDKKKKAEGYITRGGIWFGLGQYIKAISDFDKALEITPNYSFAYSSRGTSKSILGRYSEAISDFDKALSINPKDAIAYANRGTAKGNLGSYSQHEVVLNGVLATSGLPSRWNLKVMRESSSAL